MNFDSKDSKDPKLQSSINPDYVNLGSSCDFQLPE